MSEIRMNRENEKIVRKALNVFLVLFLLFGSLLGGMVALYYQSQLNTFFSELKGRESFTIELQSRLISDEFTAITGDLLYMAGHYELRENLMGEAASKFKGKEYPLFLAKKEIYDQIRFLDENGMEIVRANYNEGQPALVDKAHLQNKSSRYYFSDTLKLGKGEVFVSPLDLNVEGGEIEQPLKPMIRFGTPVFDASGRKRGVILLNYLAQTMLDDIRLAHQGEHSTPMLLNNKGFWLLGGNPEDEWGFMLADRADRTFARLYPKEWATMLAQGSGQLQTENGLFTFNKVHPLQEGHQSSTGAAETCAPSAKALGADEYFWILLSHIPPDVLGVHLKSLRVRLFFLGAGLFVFIALVAWFLALAIAKRRIYQSQLKTMALHDMLTGLPNRALFFDRLESGIRHAERHGRRLGLLYIDLDGFKEVNDTLGHEAGDELLVKVSEILRESTRASDTVARLGGDEFAVILQEIKSTQDTQIAGNKIVQALCNPMRLKSGTATIGASIGGAVYPDMGTDQDILLAHADAAMYKAKASGKNKCTMHDPTSE